MRIRRSIAQTLFLVLTGIALLVVLAMALLMRTSLERGFLEYTRTAELNHVTVVERALLYRYRESGGWGFLQPGQELMPALDPYIRSIPELRNPDEQGGTAALTPQDLHVVNLEGGPAANGPGPGFGELFPVEDDAGGASRAPASTPEPLPPALSPAVSTPAPAAYAAPPGGPGAGPQPPRDGPRGQGDMMSLGQRVALFDADGNYMAGNPKAEPKPRRAIYLVNGSARTLIGYLALAPFTANANIERDASDQGQQFLSNQLRNLTWISLCVIILSALAAILLARYFRKPIQELAEGAQLLAAGNLTIRLPVNRKDELGDVAQDFNLMAEKLESYEQSRRQWVADTSHELRTPITILSTHLEAMADGVIPSSPERLGVLAGTVADMNRLVSDLHQLASTDAGAHDYQFAPLGVTGLLSELDYAFEARLQQQQLTLHVHDDTPPGTTVEADRMRLTQVVANLLTNSSRYTDPGGEVHLRAQRDGTQLRLVVEDSTPGVPEVALPRLFDRFYRVDASRSRRSGGSGLGLAICQAIIDAHGGTIAASASALGGLRVEILLPLTRNGTQP